MLPTKKHSKKHQRATDHDLHLYARISDPSQPGLGRQLRAKVQRFCRLFKKEFVFTPSERVYVDDGVSAWHGLNQSPAHELGQFLIEVRAGRIPPGSCLLIENYDRLSRQDVWAAMALVAELREHRIHVGRLDKMRLLRHDSSDMGDFFEAAVEFGRGHSESNMKSFRNKAKWERRRRRALKKNATITKRFPAWIAENDQGERVLIPERAQVLKRIFHLTIDGYSNVAIANLLNQEKVPPFGHLLTPQRLAHHLAYRQRCAERGLCPDVTPEYEAGLHQRGRWTSERNPVPHHKKKRLKTWRPSAWCRSTISMLLRDKRVLGEFQPRDRNREPAGELLKDYFPAVVSQDVFDAAETARATRKTGDRPKGGRVSKTCFNLFTHMLVNAREGDAYYCRTRTETKKKAPVLVNANSMEKGKTAYSFPYPTFVRGILSMLGELDYKKVLHPGHAPSAVDTLQTAKRKLDERIALLQQELKTGALQEALQVLRELVDERTAVDKQLKDAQRQTADRVAHAWDTFQDLAARLDQGDKHTLLKVRAELRKIVQGMLLYVVPLKRLRACVVQIDFTGGWQRLYLLWHRQPTRNQYAKKDGRWWAMSWDKEDLTHEETGETVVTDLRDPRTQKLFAEGFLETFSLEDTDVHTSNFVSESIPVD
jgi:hypothetical protein